MKKVVLIVSAGTTDLQVLVEKGGERYRSSIGEGIRAFHQALLDGAATYRIEAGQPSPEEARDTRLRWEKDKNGFSFSDTYKIAQEETGEYALIPEKLAEIVHNVKNDRRIQVVGTIVLNTHRTDSSRNPKEPIACGKILSEWLASELKLQAASEPQQGEGVEFGHASWVNFLDGDMRQEGEDGGPLNEEAVRRINRAIHAASQWTVEEDLWAYLSLGGGMNEFKEVCASCAELYFPQKTAERKKSQFQSKVTKWQEVNWNNILYLNHYFPKEV